MEINPLNINAVKSLRSTAKSHDEQLQGAREVRQAFRDFVGQTFFGQMLKAMRSTQGKPDYFHGGQAEDVFRSQLDQTLAEHMTTASADQIADPMFARQFPQQAKLLAGNDKSQTRQSLADLDLLRRR